MPDQLGLLWPRIVGADSTSRTRTWSGGPGCYSTIPMTRPISGAAVVIPMSVLKKKNERGFPQGYLSFISIRDESNGIRPAGENWSIQGDCIHACKIIDLMCNLPHVSQNYLTERTDIK